MVSTLDEKLQPDWGKIAKSQGYLKNEYLLVISFNPIRHSLLRVSSGPVGGGGGGGAHRPGLYKAL